MKKALLTTSEVIAISIAVIIVVMTAFTLSDVVLRSGKTTVQPKLTAGVNDDNVSFDENDVDSLRSSLNVFYTNKYGQRVKVLGYGISASVKDNVCSVYIKYNGLTTTVEFNVSHM